MCGKKAEDLKMISKCIWKLSWYLFLGFSYLEIKVISSFFWTWRQFKLNSSKRKFETDCFVIHGAFTLHWQGGWWHRHPHVHRGKPFHHHGWSLQEIKISPPKPEVQTGTQVSLYGCQQEIKMQFVPIEKRDLKFPLFNTVVVSNPSKIENG